MAMTDDTLVQQVTANYLLNYSWMPLSWACMSV